MTESIWEQPESVARFAGRDPDLRLLEVLDGYEIAGAPAKGGGPHDVRVLDLGCAGGRNSEVLARRGFDLHALDASRAMVAHTRRRLRPLLGEEQAERRVEYGRMDDLGAFADACFDLVVALGIYHNATNRGEWDSALAETARVLKVGGRLLVAIFTPQTDLTGKGVRPVPGEPHLYDGFPSGRCFLVDQETLDAEMGRFGFAPEVPSRTVRVDTNVGRRVVVNALYTKTG